MEIRLFSSFPLPTPSPRVFIPSWVKVSLLGRVTTNWHENIFIAASATALSSAVLTFFLGYTLFAASFTLAGVTCILGIYYVRTAKTAEQLEKLNNSLTQRQQELEATSTRLQSENDRLNTQNNEYQRLNGELSGQIAAVQQQQEQAAALNQQLNSSCEALSSENQALHTQVKHLQHTNASLTASAQTLTSQVEILQTRLTETAAVNLQLKTSSEKVLYEVLRFKAENEQHVANNEQLRTNIETLERETKSSTALHTHFATLLEGHEKDLATKLQELNTLLTDLKTENRTKEHIDTLMQLTEKIEGSKAALQTVREQQAAEVLKLESLQSKFDKQRQQMKADHEADKKALQSIIAQFRDQLGALTTSNDRFTSLWTLFEKALLSSNAPVAATPPPSPMGKGSLPPPVEVATI